ncbi:MAG: hypothetical protein AMXMBFR4_32970 [Candidatus Hydrogenedentota bacterium]
MAADNGRERILGIDLGTNSIGWALLEFEDTQPKGIVAAGVRVFEAGVEGDIQSGKDESRNKARRDKRMQRRQFDRRARRLAHVARLLQNAGLLPPGNFQDKQTLHETIAKLDQEIYQTHKGSVDGDTRLRLTLPHVLPYWLRARALDTPLAPYELGRALYHLAQRRGFLSNRKAVSKKETEEERSQVKKSIAELEQKIGDTGARTLGEYFSRIDPTEERIRERWTSRKMYLEEFERIWAAQSVHHPKILTDPFRNQLHRAIFRQRPLKPQKNLIGKCELEPGQQRAPWSSLEAQRFRLLQKVNDLQILAPDGTRRKLSDEERKALVEVLERDGDRTFAQIRKLPQFKGCKFSHEAGGEEKLPGNRTASKLYAIFGERWFAMSESDRNRLVEDVRSIRNEEVLARRGMRVWGLDEEQAKALGAVSLQEGYCSHSKRALRKLLPAMERGESYMTALDEAYPERRLPWNAMNALPPVAHAPLGELRNPMVERSLNELRKVINALVKKHGKPDRVRIELARDLKKSRKDREGIWRQNRENEKGRSKAAQRIFEELGIRDAKRDAVERVLLAEECNWECPYTGKHISIGALLGEHPQFDVEHIIPFSRCLDNSFMNKTLCYHEENRSIKQNRTPFEAYGSNPERWDEILNRVKKFRGRGGRAKLERFRLESTESLDDFSTRQLNDTRYASRLASEFLGLLYGGRTDGSGTLRIQPTRGQVTAHLRNVWGLNRILGDGGAKSRDDHRHHAVDAVCIALTSPGTIKMLSDAARRAPLEKRRQFAQVQEPWEGFYDDIKDAIENVVVSHRVSRKVNGPLHEETIYGRGVEEGFCHVRKPLAKMSKAEVEDIVDKKVREIVKAALHEGEPKKVFSDPRKLPALETDGGSTIPIRKARIKKRLQTFALSEGHRLRHVVPAENHHMEILEVINKRGEMKWEDVIVDRYKALQRLSKTESIVQKDHGPNKRFVMSLATGDVIELDDERGGRRLCIVRSISKDLIAFVSINDARLKKEIIEARQWKLLRLNGVRRLNCRKCIVTPLGEIRRAND